MPYLTYGSRLITESLITVEITGLLAAFACVRADTETQKPIVFVSVFGDRRNLNNRRNFGPLRAMGIIGFVSGDARL